MDYRLAVIATGGKQYLVRPGGLLRVERLAEEPAARVTFGQVLLLADGEKTRIGTPLISGASVEGTLLRHGRSKKVWGVKFKPKKRYRRKFGHRQWYSEVRIERIVPSA